MRAQILRESLSVQHEELLLFHRSSQEGRLDHHDSAAADGLAPRPTVERNLQLRLVMVPCEDLMECCGLKTVVFVCRDRPFMAILWLLYGSLYCGSDDNAGPFINIFPILGTAIETNCHIAIKCNKEIRAHPVLVYIYIYIYIHVEYVELYAYTDMCRFLYVLCHIVCFFAYTCIYTYCVYAFMHVFLYVCVYVCICMNV